jgi:hypothetical protein
MMGQRYKKVRRKKNEVKMKLKLAEWKERRIFVSNNEIKRKK